MTVVRIPVEERFWPKVDFNAPNGCWEWTGQRDKDGYGRFRICTEKQGSAHRVSFALWNGYFPPEHTDHLCNNPPCVHPLHLRAATPRENVLRSSGGAALNAAKTHCKRGHPLTEDNVYIKRPKSGGLQRICRACHRADQLQRYRRTKAT